MSAQTGVGDISGATSGTSDSKQYVDLPIRDPAHDLDEEGPWAGKTVLSFDGGGIRGYSSLLILKAIMIQIRELELKHEGGRALSSSHSPWMVGGREESESNGISERHLDNYLPCHYFDYMAGTSTGGLTSIMLGRLRMSVDQAMDQYQEFGNAVFSKPRWSHARSILWSPAAKFSTRDTRRAFQEIIYKSLQHKQDETVDFHQAKSELFQYNDPRGDRTRVIAISYSINESGDTGRPFLWRSYERSLTLQTRSSLSVNHRRLTARGLCPQIWQVARATTAAPGYFEPIELGERRFLDGGMVANNPSLLTLKEVRSHHEPLPALLVSIGTGLKGHAMKTAKPLRASSNDDGIQTPKLKNLLEVGRSWKDFMIDCEGENGTSGWRSLCGELGIQENAYRLNVTGVLSKLVLDDWRPSKTGKTTLDLIRKATTEYLEEEDVRRNIRAIAIKAVDIRRQRADTEKWESFAVDVYYRCCECSKAAEQTHRFHYHDRHCLRQHLRYHSRHTRSDGSRMTDKEIEEAIQSGRMSGSCNNCEMG